MNEIGGGELKSTTLVHEHKGMSLQALNLVVGMYLQPFEGANNI